MLKISDVTRQMWVSEHFAVGFNDGSVLRGNAVLLDPEKYGKEQARKRHNDVVGAFIDMRLYVEKIEALTPTVTCGPLFFPIVGEKVEKTASGYKYVFDYCGRIQALNTRREIEFSCLADLARQRLDGQVIFSNLRATVTA